MTIDRLLQDFTIENEVSLLTNKLSITSRHSIGKHDPSNLRRVVDQEVHNLKRDFRTRFEQDQSGNKALLEATFLTPAEERKTEEKKKTEEEKKKTEEEKKTEEKKKILLKKASAYYVVAMRHRQECISRGEFCYLGFPFIVVSEELDQIKRENRSIDTSTEELVLELTKILNEGIVEVDMNPMNEEEVRRIVFNRCLDWFISQWKQVLPSLNDTEDMIDKLKTSLPVTILKVSKGIRAENMSTGNLFLQLLHQLKEDMFSQEEPCPILGFFSLGSLVKIYSNCSLDHLFSLESNPRKSDSRKSDPRKSNPRKSNPRKSDPRKSNPRKSDPRKSDPRKSDSRKLMIEKHHISLEVDPNFRENVINKHLDRFLIYLKDESTIEDISCNIYSKGNEYHYLLLIALGNDWSLRCLERIVRDRNFFVNTCRYFEQNVTFKKNTN